MRTLCYSVRLNYLERISNKCFKAVSFDGSEALIPEKFIFGQDTEVQKCNAYWIAAWILERKDLTYSHKKSAWFDENGNIMPKITVEKHIPDKIDPVVNNEIKSLEI